jgi:ABC-type transport system involved in cytochrome c biogenesis permease subunit
MIATTAFFLLLVALLLQVVFLLRKEPRRERLSSVVILVAAILLFVEIVLRSIAIRFVAVTNTYESLLFFSAVILLLVFLYRFFWKGTVFPLLAFGAGIVALALLAIASSPIASADVKAPIPALQSNWLVLHVTFSFIGEAFFAVGFVSALYYLITKDQKKKEKLDTFTYTVIALGYPVFTAGALVFGAIWASYAWGRFWSWDPKETWAFITWLTYTVFLHSRFIKKLRGPFVAWMSILGFAFTLFTFFGVNFLLSGLHSYG